MFRFLIVTVCVLSAGCSSPVRADGDTQEVAVQVVDAEDKAVSGAECTLKNNFGSWHVVAPGTVSVRTSKEDLIIQCSKSGASGGRTASAKMTGKPCGSIASCGGIGFVINDRTGAGFAYPGTISVAIND